MALAYVKVADTTWPGIDAGLGDLETRMGSSSESGAALVINAYRALVMATPAKRNRVCAALRRAARKGA